MYIKVVITILLLTTWYMVSASWAQARMESPLFRIDWGNINIGAKNMDSATYDLTTTLGQTAAKQFSEGGYIIKAGFQYVHSIIPFSFSISKINVDFGTIAPGSFYDDTITLTVYFGSAGQYQVTAAENGALKTFNGLNSIPDTTCNQGASTCTTTAANVWNDATKDGFGYNMTGNDIPADFVSSSYFRPFSDTSTGASPVVVMSNSDVGKNRQSIMKLRLAISNIQAAGSYNTVVHYVATPSY